MSKRLTAILHEIDTDIVADIGCDHGKIAVLAILLKKAKKAIAIDISDKSLQKAKSLAKKHNILDKVECIVGDGLKPIRNRKVGTVVIAGLGGNEIIRILEEGHSKLSCDYVLVPHQDSVQLREYLKENNYCAYKDYVIEDNKIFYDIILARQGRANYRKNELYTGKNIPHSSDYIKKLKARQRAIETIIKQADGLDKISLPLRTEWEEVINELHNKRYH